jgi:hypothetical protein
MKELTSLPRLYAVVALASVLQFALAGCGDTDKAPALSPSPSNTAQPSATPPTGMVEIGGGRKVYAECACNGSPTIILESGDESDHYQWSQVAPGLAEHARTSHPADVKGWSSPKRITRSSPHAIIAKQAPKELLEELKCDSPTNKERRDYVKVENEAWNNRHRIGDIPLTVITNDYGDVFENEEQRTNVEGQKGWLKLSPRARQIIVTSGHNLPENEPELVIKEVLNVLEAAR